MCDTIGRLHSSNGPLFAKNSDRSPNEPQVLEWYPAAVHNENKVKATYIRVEQVKETKALILSRPTWLWGGEIGVNECGVCIGNEAVFTKGKYGKASLTGMDMVRLALERSESAREALDWLIRLLEQYGQGGNCGYDHDFFYDNAFLVMDRGELYVLETAGKKWVYKKGDCEAISNRLSIGTEGDAYSEGKPYDFAKKHTEPLHTRMSKVAGRKALTGAGLEMADSVLDMFATLRRHDHEDNPLCKGSVGSPCMHFGGRVGDQTTQSMAVEFPENGEIHLWVTGRSTPCISMFKPFAFGNEPVAPIYEARDERARQYWMRAEYFHRRMLGKVIPQEYYEERDAVEAELYALSRGCDAKTMQELSIYALKKEQDFVERWRRAKLEPVKVSAVFKRNWDKKNEELRNE